MARLLIVAAHRPDRSPSQRFRFEQYIDFLRDKGIEVDFQYLISAEDDRVFYSKDNYLKKLLFLLRSYRKRKKKIAELNQYDIVLVQREAFMTKSIFFEKAVNKSSAKMVFDFDDSIWLQNVSEANKSLNWLKDSLKTSKIIALSDMVFAGNKYLGDYASQFNSNVRIVPTTIDTQEYKPVHSDRNKSVLTIGWSGSVTTIQHFNESLGFLRRIKAEFGDKVKIMVVGDKDYRNAELDVIGLPWRKDTEQKDLNSFDIGIMPLPDDEWASGKCGLKGLQYMALEIPTIMSPVGVNSEIIENGVNGFLASTEEEWVSVIRELIASKDLRERIGKAARETVLNKYSVEANKSLYLNNFTELINH